MRLSDAIAVGRVLIQHPSADNYCNCALGMGLAAVGKCKPHPRLAYDAIMREWPWLGEGVKSPDWMKRYGYETMQAEFTISHAYDMVQFGVLTLDQLIDWVRSVEPAEPEEVATVADEKIVPLVLTEQ
jgi:hypothetical protein